MSIAPASSSHVASIDAAFSVLGGRHVLVTGGTGYIGSHTVLALLQLGVRVTIVDNLSNSSLIALERVESILASEPGRAKIGTPQAKPAFHQVDLRDYAALEAVFKTDKFDACIHFAGLKSVGESVSKPLVYYEHNVCGTVNLLKLLEAYNCRRIVFSSSATVYGLAEKNPIPETAPLSTTNPYGQTKLVIEGILQDIAKAPLPATPASADGSAAATAANSAWSIVILRYFNPIGAHPSGLIGEDPLGIPNNLLPFIMQVAVGRRKELSVFGADYPTKDGTGVRDYIHVQDLAAGHVAALQHRVLGGGQADGQGQGSQLSHQCEVFNLGTGSGVSVLEMVSAASAASGKEIPYKVAPRRSGDIGTCYADAAKARELLKWSTKKTLQEAMEDSWRWQSKNPYGYLPHPTIERENEALSTAAYK